MISYIKSLVHTTYCIYNGNQGFNTVGKNEEISFYEAKYNYCRTKDYGETRYDQHM